jgi:hypothetical protein
MSKQEKFSFTAHCSPNDPRTATILLFNPLKMKLVYILFKNSVRTSERTPHFTITKFNWLMLFKEIITVYSENHTKTNKYKMQHY